LPLPLLICYRSDPSFAVHPDLYTVNPMHIDLFRTITSRSTLPQYRSAQHRTCCHSCPRPVCTTQICSTPPSLSHPSTSPPKFSSCVPAAKDLSAR
ncbi:unnamed protein product, partial [Citrullus colocynthis]